MISLDGGFEDLIGFGNKVLEEGFFSPWTNFKKRISQLSWTFATKMGEVWKEWGEKKNINFESIIKIVRTLSQLLIKMNPHGFYFIMLGQKLLN